MTTIAVLGANGRLSRAVAKEFLEAGHSVVAVTRTGRIPAELAGATSAAANALDRDALLRATEGAEIIFNGLNPLYTDWEDTCLSMAENVMAACRAHKATHLFPGNVYGFASPLPPVLDEATPLEPTNRKGEIRTQMEALFALEAERSGVRTIILRAGDFFGGTGAGTWLDLVMASKAAKGTYTHPGPLDLVHAWAYLPDLARTFVKLAERRAEFAAFEGLNFPGHNATGEEMAAAVEKALGRPLKRTTLPWLMIRMGGLVKPMWRELARMSYLWFEPHSLVSRRLEGLIGTVPHTPLDEAVGEALRDLGLAGASEGKRAA